MLAHALRVWPTNRNSLVRKMTICLFVLLVGVVVAQAQESNNTTTAATNATGLTAVGNSTAALPLPGTTTRAVAGAAEPFAVTEMLRLAEDIASEWGDDSLAQTASDASLQRDTLLVFLGEVRALTSVYTTFLKTCAGQGYHCIVLPWPNTLFAQIACSSVGGECVPLYREQVITGKKKTSVLTLPLDDSIEARLERALARALKERPLEGWGQFANSAWRKAVAFAGTGEGGTYAAFWACAINEAQRVLLFDGPVDRDPKTEASAAWVSSATCKTPKERFFAMYHTASERCTAAVASLTSLGVRDDATEIARFVVEKPDTIQSWCNIDPRRVCTNLASRSKLPIDSGRSVVEDSQLPVLLDGTVEYTRVWQQLLGSNAPCPASNNTTARGTCTCTAAPGVDPVAIGLAVGLSLLVIALIVLGVFLWRRKKKAKGGW
jgi:hypothetical protein